MKHWFTISLLLIVSNAFSQVTPFEKSNGQESATYFEAIDFYKKLDNASGKVFMKEAGATDAGFPLHVVLVSNDGKFNVATWHRQKKVVIMINNGIHAGEPDGIDATMMLVRDIVSGKLTLPANVALAIIPVYNIGGALNRNSTSRVNQEGPVSYGFRGNSQNLDLNRDFIKCDSREAKSFTKIFHELDPDIFIDNHVTDGADFQYTMTLITTQYDKLGEPLGKFLKEKFEPLLYSGMKQQNFEMTPYVDWTQAGAGKEMEQFYETARYSSGFAALFQTLSFIPETHMLKPFADRVRSTYALEKVFIDNCSSMASQIIEQRQMMRNKIAAEKQLTIKWTADSSKFEILNFKGYEQGKKRSDVTGNERMFYDRTKPYTRPLKYYNVFNPTKSVDVPKYYFIPQGWHEVIDRLKINGVTMNLLQRDTTLVVQAYRIENYKNYGPFEKHYLNYDVQVSTSVQKINLRKGDVVVPVDQPVKRYIIEMLEPVADDSFFAWNFFDAILQEKEHYSDYRWEDIAAEVLRDNPELKSKLEQKKKGDEKFAANAKAQLEFVYKNSKYYEPEHMRYPVFKGF